MHSKGSAARLLSLTLLAIPILLPWLAVPDSRALERLLEASCYSQLHQFTFKCASYFRDQSSVMAPFNNISSETHANTLLGEGAKPVTFNFNVIHSYLASLLGIDFLHALCFERNLPGFNLCFLGL